MQIQINSLTLLKIDQLFFCLNYGFHGNTLHLMTSTRTYLFSGLLLSLITLFCFFGRLFTSTFMPLPLLNAYCVFVF